MRHLQTAITVSIIAIVLFMAVDWKSIDFYLLLPIFAKSSIEEPVHHDEPEEELWAGLTHRSALQC